MKINVCCPSCNSTSVFGPWSSPKADYTLYQCSHCSLRFSDPMRAADVEWYKKSSIYFLKPRWLESGKQGPRWEFLQALQGERPQDRNLLDVGCRHGEFLSLAEKAGYVVAGADFNPDSLEFVRNTYGITSLYCCSVLELPKRIPGEQFDVVTMFEILEHVEEPLRLILALKTLIRAEGLLCLSVPCYQRWPRQFDPEVDSPPHHLTLWTEDALREILSRAGLEFLRVERKPLQQEELGVLLKLRLQRILPRRAPRQEDAAPVSPRTSRRLGAGLDLRSLIRSLVVVVLSPVC